MGWRDLIHRLSHKFHARLHSAPKEHDPRHLQLEAEMVNWVVSRGWLDGKLRTLAKSAKPSNAPVRGDPGERGDAS